MSRRTGTGYSTLSGYSLPSMWGMGRVMWRLGCYVWSWGMCGADAHPPRVTEEKALEPHVATEAVEEPAGGM